MQGIAIIACLRPWKARNEKIHAGSGVKIKDIIGNVKALSLLWYLNKSKYENIELAIAMV
ncbi:hypothetical protein Hanom_Chr04g00367021 [Helianthus anomalus]